MKVVLAGRMTLVDDVSKFYALKSLGQCPLCNAGIQTSTANRTLRAQCAPGCPNNMSIPVPRVTTYDRAVELARHTLAESTDKVLQAKFNFLFQFTKEKSLDDLKLAYIQARQNFNDVQSAYANKTRAPDLREALQTLKDASGPGKKREWCARYRRFQETEARMQHLKYKGATEVLEMMPYTWSELEIIKV